MNIKFNGGNQSETETVSIDVPPPRITVINTGTNQVTGTSVNPIMSNPNGDWKQITAMEYNIVTGLVRITFES